MTSLLYDEIDMDAEEWGDDEDFDAYGDPEASNRDTRKRRTQARQRRVDLARRRQAQSRARGTTPVRRPATPAVTQRATESAIRTLDLENKVAQDTFRSTNVAADKRMSRAEYSAVASAAVAQFIETFNTPQNDIAKAALRFAPLLLLAPQKKGTGIESYSRDPRVLGLAAVGTIVLIGEVRKKGDTGNQVRISGPAQLTEGTSATFFADVLDGNGNVVNDVTVTWEAEPAAVATVNPTSGPTTTVTAVAAGNAAITARAGKLIQRFQLTVAGYGGSKAAEDDTAPKPPARAGGK
jgi:hypothetical protein